MSRSKSLTIRFNRLLYHPKRPNAKFHVTSDRTKHLRRGSTHPILDERGNPIDSIDEKLIYLRIFAICETAIVRFMLVVLWGTTHIIYPTIRALLPVICRYLAFLGWREKVGNDGFAIECLMLCVSWGSVSQRVTGNGWHNVIL